MKNSALPLNLKLLAPAMRAIVVLVVSVLNKKDDKKMYHHQSIRLFLLHIIFWSNRPPSSKSELRHFLPITKHTQYCINFVLPLTDS